MLLVPVVLDYIISFLRADEKQINRCAKNRRVTRDKDMERANRIFHESPESFPALVDPLPGLQPLKPDGRCLLAMLPDPYTIVTHNPYS